jgi:hypothetical protein
MPRFFLLLWKHLIILKILPVTFFKDLVAAFRNPLGTVKLDLEPLLGFWKLFRKPPLTCVNRAIFPLSNERWSRGENWPMTEIVSQRRILMLLSVQVSEFVSVFIEASHIFVINSFFNRSTKKSKNHWFMSRKYWCNFKTWKNYPCGDTVPLTEKSAVETNLCCVSVVGDGTVD